MNQESKPTARKENIVVQQVQDETLVYDLVTNKAVCLNQTSAIIWDFCDGKTSLNEIARKLTMRFGTPVDLDFVLLAIDKLGKENLIGEEDSLTDHFHGFSRREVVKRIGFASAITLPIVSSIAAPSAANAQSCMGTTPSGSVYRSPIITVPNPVNTNCVNHCQSNNFFADQCASCTADTSSPGLPASFFNPSTGSCHCRVRCA